MKKYLLLAVLIFGSVFGAYTVFAGDPPNEFYLDGSVVHLDMIDVYNCGTNELVVIDANSDEIYANTDVFGKITDVDLYNLTWGTLPYEVYVCGGGAPLTYSGPIGTATAPAAEGDIISGTFDLKGWGWSSNFGWISFNSANTGISGGPSYKVRLNTTTGSFSGHAWSPNLGWLIFDSSYVTSCPTGSCPAKVADMSTGKVTGWIRALSAMASEENSGGWFELAGTNHTSPGGGGITYKDGKLTGYAWGGNLGWLQFYDVTCDGCEANAPVAPNLGASTSGVCGGRIELSWNDVSGATSYKLYRDGTLIYSGNATSRTDTVLSGSTHSYQVRAVNTVGESPLSTARSATASTDCVSNGLDLRIGVDNANATGNLGHATRGKSLLINAGEPFALAWTNALSPSVKLTCVSTLTSPVTVPGFTNTTVQTDRTASVLGSGTATLPVGTYPISIECPPNTGPRQTVYLIVSDSDEGPI